MRTVLHWFGQRPFRLFGGFLVFLSLGMLAFLVFLDITGGLANPYLGILTYMVLPGVLGLGLVLVPLDAWIQRRRAARGKPAYYFIDLGDPSHRRIGTFFAVSSGLILIAATVVSYRSVLFMDTRTFCGQVCHRVMRPEYTAYARSSHASVECVACHIGPGASWFVRSKLSGVPQAWHYLRQDYVRPVKAPVANLRPSRDTCETCHWPRQFHGSSLKTRITYRQDRNNTRDARTMVMYVGSGAVPGSGIHSHMVSHIDYLPATSDRSQIAWVRTRRHDGSVHEYVNPGYERQLGKLRSAAPTRVMDCIDCHNRSAHDFRPFEDLLDEAITREEVDATLPFIKRKAMAAVQPGPTPPTQAEQDRTVQRIRGIEADYARELPQLYSARRADIQRSVQGIERVYLGTYFPHMKIGPTSYPSWKSHDGCFRCHGVLVRSDAAGAGQALSADCSLCHSQEKVEVARR